jgi:hypothetical protein
MKSMTAIIASKTFHAQALNESAVQAPAMMHCKWLSRTNAGVLPVLTAAYQWGDRGVTVG